MLTELKLMLTELMFHLPFILCRLSVCKLQNSQCKGIFLGPDLQAASRNTKISNRKHRGILPILGVNLSRPITYRPEKTFLPITTLAMAGGHVW